MMLLTVEEVISLHKKIVQKIGGSGGLRDRGLLESAVYSAEGGYGEVEIYPTTEEKAARLAFAVIQSHPFVDGNKRVGIMLFLLTLRLNQVEIRYTQKELISLGLKLASGAAGQPEAQRWIYEHEV